MSKSNEPEPKPEKPEPNKLQLKVREGANVNLESAKLLAGPLITNAFALSRFGKGTIGEIDLDSLVTALGESSSRVNANDLKDVESTLNSQSIVLNIMFGELIRRAGVNLAEYPMASDRYFKMAMKAQNQCRMTLETLANIKNPPVVYAKQANIANGPQQVNNGSMPLPHAEKNLNGPNKLLEQGNEQRMDTATEGKTSSSNSALETVESGNGA